jgi:hypothetical protein
MIPHPGRAEQRFWRRWLGPPPASGSELMSVAIGAQGKVMQAIRPFLLLESPVSRWAQDQAEANCAVVVVPDGGEPRLGGVELGGDGVLDVVL